MIETTTLTIEIPERNWLERLKRKHKIKTLAETLKRVRKVITEHKMEGEL